MQQYETWVSCAAVRGLCIMPLIPCMVVTIARDLGPFLAEKCMLDYSEGPPLRNFTYKKGCTMFCGRWLRKFVQGKRVGFLATMVLLLCGRQQQPLPIGLGRAYVVIFTELHSTLI